MNPFNGKDILSTCTALGRGSSRLRTRRRSRRCKTVGFRSHSKHLFFRFVDVERRLANGYLTDGLSVCAVGPQVFDTKGLSMADANPWAQLHLDARRDFLIITRKQVRGFLWISSEKIQRH